MKQRTKNHTENAKNTKGSRTADPNVTRFDWGSLGYIMFLLAWAGLVLLVVQYLVGIPMIWILKDRFNQHFWTCIYYGLSYSISLVLTIIALPKVQNKIRNDKSDKKNHDGIGQATSHFPSLQTSRTELGLQGFPSLTDIGLAPIAYIIYLVISYVLTSAMSVFTWFDSQETQDIGFGYFVTTGDRIAAMIALVFIAPIAEEVMMRGWLYGKLREKLNIPITIILVSLLFGLLHGQWNVSVGVFGLSLVLCGLREITGTIWAGILLHMLSNGIAFYLLCIAI